MRMWRKGNPRAPLVGMQTGAVTVESSMEEIPQKIINGPAFWPSNPSCRNLSEGTQNPHSKQHKHPYVHCSVIYNRQDMEAAQLSINRWVDKTTIGHLHNKIALGHKKKKILPLVTAWMDLENIMLSEISQWEKDKHHMILLICGF